MNSLLYNDITNVDVRLVPAILSFFEYQVQKTRIQKILKFSSLHSKFDKSAKKYGTDDKSGLILKLEASTLRVHRSFYSKMPLHHAVSA